MAVTSARGDWCSWVELSRPLELCIAGLPEPTRFRTRGVAARVNSLTDGQFPWTEYTFVLVHVGSSLRVGISSRWGWASGKRFDFLNSVHQTFLRCICASARGPTCTGIVYIIQLTSPTLLGRENCAVTPLVAANPPMPFQRQGKVQTKCRSLSGRPPVEGGRKTQHQGHACRLPIS